MIDYSLIEKPQELTDLTSYFQKNNIASVAMDFEEESNLHIYGEHLCLIQLFDKKKYYVVDAVEILKNKNGSEAIKTFLESPVEKIMFDCSSDAAIVRKTLGIQMQNIFDLRVYAKALGFMGNLTSLIERNLHIQAEDPNLKKKYQRANWIKRPLSDEQLKYALGDVQYLFQLKDSLTAEMKTLDVSEQKKADVAMRNCAIAKHREKPGWEKICNYKSLTKNQKVFIRYFFNARDSIAKKANVPPTNIVEKQLIVEMAKRGTWQGILDKNKIRYSCVFEQARLAALEELGK